MIDTIPQMFFSTVKTYPKETFMMFKRAGRYESISTEEFGNRVQSLSLGLKELGFQPGDKLIILSENRPEWVMTDLAVQCAEGITVPIYTSLVPDQVAFIIEDCEAGFVVVSNAELWEKIKAVKPRLKKVRRYITFAAETPEDVYGFADVLHMGQERAGHNPLIFEKEAMAVQPGDVASIIYTSGTTGVPKGVILTHGNFLSNVKAASTILPFSEKDTVLSFLPLSHILERMVMFTYIYKGCTIAFAESLETVADNLLEVQPMIMVSVPRVFEKIYSKVIDTVLAGSAVKRRIFFWALKVGREHGRRVLEGEMISRGLKFKRRLADKLVFQKIVAKTGGRVRFFVSGGAPLSKDIAEFFYAIGLYIMEGYGVTETSPALALNTFEALRFGTVGKPIPGVQIRIAPDGEILARGPNIMKGYYKKEAETREAFEGGWFHTGDIGHLDRDGFLVITDRKKDIIVTAGGKNIAPQPIENLLKTNVYVSNAIVVGDRRRFLAALIVPNFEKLEAYARTNGIAYQGVSDLVKNAKIISLLTAEVEKATPGLAPYEKIKKILILDRDFEIEKEEMTPTLKVKRNIVEAKYKDLIDGLYKEDQENKV
ncbi:MAG: long-chain fatty acid--CoA ligase [Candidatus Aminicenantes bacterium]|nr:long-chain fatty acid--CoA ligase [Candidatus Aminicenantes bacterium]